MKIKLNDEYINVGLAKDNDTLSVILLGVTDVAAVYAAFAPGLMPEIVIYDDELKTSAIYANHKITAVYWHENDIQVNLQVDPLEVSAAIRLTEEMNMEKETSSVSEDAIAELAALLADLEMRVTALEPPVEEGEEEPDEGEM